MQIWLDGGWRVIAASILLFGSLVFLAPDANAQALVRGPYLQLGTPTSMVVRWRTDVASETTLEYGPSSTNLSTTISAPGPVTEHEVLIENLNPATRYYYSVGTSSLTLAGADADHYFTTSPVVGSQQATRMWVIGDSGGNTWRSAAVTAEYLNFAGSQLADVWLMLGDNAYLWGTDAEHTSAVFDNYPTILRNTVLWPAPGNHEFSGVAGSSNMAAETGPYYEAFTVPTLGEAGGVPSGTETYYSYDYANIHFVSFNVYPSGYQVGGTAYNWLQADLAATDQEWIIVYLHFPPYSRGERDSDTDFWMKMVRETYNSVFETAGVDLVLTGHSHSYERSKLIDGHYGVASTLAPANIIGDGDGSPLGNGRYNKPAGGGIANSGTVYVVNGVGENAHIGGALDHPIMVNSFQIEGSMIIDIEGSVLDAYFVSRQGILLDQFGILKGAEKIPSMTFHGLVVMGAVMVACAFALASRRARSSA